MLTIKEIAEMKIIAYTVCFVLLTFFAGSSFSQGTEKETGETGTLTLVMSGFNNDKGNARIALCNSKEDYGKPDNTFRSAIGVIKNGKSEWTFPDLPFGTYAVKVYHDENNNGKLDKNAFGAPKERYGFSNNVRATFGPPAYEKAQFTFNTSGMSINIAVE